MELRDYQVGDLAFTMARKRSGNFSDPGTGKTAPACVWFYWLWSDKKVRSIWTMPKSLMKKNREELLQWSEFAPEDVVIVAGDKKRRQRLMASDAKVFIMTFAGFGTEWPELVRHHPDVRGLAGDEWHLGFKSDSSGRTRSLYRFFGYWPVSEDRPEDEPFHDADFLLAMTGTIIDGRLDAAFPLIQLCAPHHYRDIYHFQAKHGIENSYGQIVAWRYEGDVGKIFKEMAVRHSFEEVYGPEAKIIQHELCEMEPAQRAAYTEFEETALLELEDSWLDGTLPGPNFIRCRQLMEHPQDFGPPLDKIKATGKEDRILIHLEDHKNTGKPLVIFSALVPQHDRLHEMCKKLKLRVAVINGRVSANRRFQIDEDFRAGKIDVVIASAATAGVGFNWGHVDHIIFASLDPMDSNFVQAYRRAIRGKRETPLLITVMEYENSMDQRLFDIVERKSALGNKVDETKERITLREQQPKPKGKAKTKSGFTMSDLI